LNPNLSLTQRNLQYITTVSNEPDDNYIFATLHQKTLRFSLRLNFSITPNLSIQYWGQPFISAGKFNEFKKITDTHANEYTDRYRIFPDDEFKLDNKTNFYKIIDGTAPNDSIDNPDFNIKEFKSNFVVRWELIPGSTLYFVWSQGRDRSNPNGEFDLKQDICDMFDIHPHDIFLIKFSYRFVL
jgi:hypothetical protein